MRPDLRHPQTPRRLASAAAILLVGALYLFWGSNGRFGPWLAEGVETPYAALAEGFRQGNLSLAWPVNPALEALANPYDPAQRQAANVAFPWDVSLYEGRYYLYFSPLPVLLFDLPVRLVTGQYPAPYLGGTVFAFLAFLAGVSLLRALARLVGTDLGRSEWLWILALGIGTVLPFNLARVMMYESAILCAAMLTTLCLRLGLRLVAGGGGYWTAAGFGAAWMLAVAARPNLAVASLPIAAMGVAGIWRARRSWAHLARAAACAAAPAAVILTAMLSYNAARFGSPFEFGIRYQLTCVEFGRYDFCAMSEGRHAERWWNGFRQYVGLAPRLVGEFPFVRLRSSTLHPHDWQVNDGNHETAGVLGTWPHLALGTLCLGAAALRRRREGSVGAAGLFAALALAGALCTLAYLASCALVIARYTIDFLPFVTAAALVGLLGAAGRGVLWRAAVGAALAVAVLIGFLLGFTGEGDYFARVGNPALIEALRAATAVGSR